MTLSLNPFSGAISVVLFALENETGVWDVTVLEDIYPQYGKQISSSSALLVEDHLDERGKASVIARKLTALDRNGPKAHNGQGHHVKDCGSYRENISWQHTD